MKREEWDALAYRAAMVRHKMWCIAREDPKTGERMGNCLPDGTINVFCQGPRSGDIELGKAIALEFWGKPDD